MPNMSFKVKHSAKTLKAAKFIKLFFIKGLSPQHVKVSKGMDRWVAILATARVK